MTAIKASMDKSLTRASAQHLGGKAATLVELQSAGFRVPEFEVSPSNLGAAVERLGMPLVVRSSATAEDGDEASFAGQFSSYLNRRTIDQVREAVSLCHDSLKLPSVLEYCRQQCVDPDTLRMEVIVQRMIEPELAGVAFTVNPATGAQEVVVEACEGLADGLLAGREESLPPDHPLLEKYRDDIARIARRIQLHFGKPQDIEFAIESGMIYILQSRPITRIGFRGDVGQWTNADFRDGGVSSTVCSPLMWSLYQMIWDQSLKNTLRELKLFQRDFSASRMFFGRPYWNLGAVKECLLTLPGFVEREFDQDLSVQINYEGDGRVIPMTPLRILRAIPTVMAVKKFFKTQKKDAEHLLSVPVESSLQSDRSGFTDVEAAFQKLIETDYVRIETTYFRTIFATSLAKLDFMSSFPKVDYGSLVSSLPPLHHFEPVRRVQSMSNRTPEQLSRLIDAFRYHYRIGLDVIHPRWDEDRRFVQEMLAELPKSAGNDPNPVYESCRSATLKCLPRRKHDSFDRKLRRLRHFLWLREQLRDRSSYLYYQIRSYALDLAKRRGLGESIFFQTYSEILDDHRDQIEQNRETYESYRNFRSPNEIGSGFEFNDGRCSGEIEGIGASPGTLTGEAFVAHNVQQAVQMPRGRILVCPYTDPGWTAVLDRAGGVVTETGGLLSHAAIICREYGIPAVLGVHNATARITSGNKLLIDGTDGRISIDSLNRERER